MKNIFKIAICSQTKIQNFLASLEKFKLYVELKRFSKWLSLHKQCIMMEKEIIYNILQNILKIGDYGVCENSHIQIVAPLHSQHLTVWCVIGSKHIITPIFRTITGASCWWLLIKEFQLQVHHHHMIHIYWFMESSACCYYVFLWNC